ncbi:MAG: 50S ribosomal protein L3 [Candidatus Omnitrophica bacterium]|nr:50S ribosomal protein L3 [Candidatus Omnitrophota bacterium]
MSSGLLGKKIGMTQVFNEDKRIVVTAIEAGPCYVLGENDKKIQLGFEEVKDSKLKKPQRDFFKKIKVKPLRFIREFLKDAGSQYQIGQELKADLFASGNFVDITGISIGKGFQGGMKRWHWKGGPKTHGSMSHRRPGAIGSSSDPSRVFKGHHLPGHMGAQRVTVQNLKVIKTDAENNIILVKGAVPGHRNSLLVINFAKKKSRMPVDEPKTEAKAEIKAEAKKETKAKPEPKKAAKQEAKKETKK